MHRTMLGEDFARSMNVPLADLVYLQKRPITLMPRGLDRRLGRLRAPRLGRESRAAGTRPGATSRRR